AKNDGKYRIDINSPEDYKGNIVLYDGKLVWQYNPHLENNKICANPPEKASRREIILFSFLENYNTSMETTAVSVPTVPKTILEAPLKSTSPLFFKEKLFINNDEMLPEKLVIYDKENKERIVVKFTDFKYNIKLEDEIFKIS
ncbi:MAG: outer membrane lipoprotein carrier protein LolA, partial [Lachnospirales bacterium]